MKRDSSLPTARGSTFRFRNSSKEIERVFVFNPETALEAVRRQLGIIAAAIPNKDTMDEEDLRSYRDALVRGPLRALLGGDRRLARVQQ